MTLNLLHFWNRIDLKRGELTLKELADRANIPYNRIANQRSLLRVPTAEDLMNIAIVLNTTVDYLLYGMDESFSICPEALAVQNDQNLQALVRAVRRDPRLIQIIGTLIESTERNIRDA